MLLLKKKNYIAKRLIRLILTYNKKILPCRRSEFMVIHFLVFSKSNKNIFGELFATTFAAWFWTMHITFTTIHYTCITLFCHKNIFAGSQTIQIFLHIIVWNKYRNPKNFPRYYILEWSRSSKFYYLLLFFGRFSPVQSHTH